MGLKSKIIIEDNVSKKYCSKCNNLLPLDKFSINNGSTTGRKSQCKNCISNNLIEKENNRVRCKDYYITKGQTMARDIKRKDIRKYLYNSAKSRALLRHQEFSIELEDVVITSICPLLGIEMQYNEGIKQDNSYSLDRIDSTKGYVKGNIWIISLRANRIKNDSTIEELEQIVKNLKIKLEK